MSQPASSEALGINGLGRIGKLTLWHHAARRFFPRIVVNLGREAGRDLETVCQTIEKDSTYGSMHRFLFGVNAEPCVKIVDRDQRLLTVAGTPVQVLQEARNPRDIGWKERGARIVVDTTGVFGDPTDAPGAEKGALRGHLEAGAEKVLYSAAFKIKDKSLELPDDSVLLIYGINHDQFDPARHHLISAASCTTTALAHMVSGSASVLEHAHRGHEHGARRDQQPERAGQRAQGRREGPAQDPQHPEQHHPHLHQRRRSPRTSSAANP
jgi:glyceraldehyde 3-phosphate dehydrogenase